jgi:apolipoprotein N-acyltransferase
MVRVSAAAIGEDVAHAAITGKSTFITADGSVGDGTPLFEATVLTGEIRQRTAGPTVYARFGDWLVILAVAAAAIAVVLPGGRRAERTAPGLAGRSFP